MAAKGKKQSEEHAPRILNRKARHDYHIEESFEVGIQLRGTEVKSIRQGKVSIGEAFARVEPKTSDLWLYGMDVALYDHADPQGQHDPKRKRKLLAHKREIERLAGLTSSKGVTLVPLTLYFTDRGIAKIELGVAVGKAHEDKRQDIKKRDAEKRMKQAMTRKRIG